MTRVVHLISDAGPHPYFNTLVEHADRRDFDLAIGCVGPAGPLQDEMRARDVRTFALGARSRRGYPRAATGFVRMLRRQDVDVVQCHLVDACLVGLSAARVARTPLAIHTAHHSHELPYHGRRLVWAERLCAGPLADRIIAPSRQVADTLVATAKVRPEKIEVIHHGFDLDRFDRSSVDGQRVRRELGLSGATVLGAIGRNYRLKNYDALVRAFAPIAAEHPDARLVIAGPGGHADLEALAGDLEIADRVVLCGARSDVPDLLAAFDVFVHPAVAESFGMVIVEAMAAGRPVVATPVGIAPDAIEPGISGMLAADASSQALEAALGEMLRRREDWEAMGEAARRRAQAFPAAAMVKAYERLYLGQVRGRQPPLGA
jgi:glycosyltransferase involved in cell wall biosynthesis